MGDWTGLDVPRRVVQLWRCYCGDGGGGQVERQQRRRRPQEGAQGGAVRHGGATVCAGAGARRVQRAAGHFLQRSIRRNQYLNHILCITLFSSSLWYYGLHLFTCCSISVILLFFYTFHLFFSCCTYTVQLFSPPFLHRSHFPIYFSSFPLSPFLIRLFSPGVLREKEGGRRWFPQFFSLSRASHDSSSFLLLLSLGPKAVSRILCARNGKEMVLNFRRVILMGIRSESLTPTR